MTNNFIYSNFIKAFLKNRATNPINLEEAKTYKMAIFNSKYTPDEDTEYTFYNLQDHEDEYEVVDLNDSYEAGGSYIKFTDMDKDQYGRRDESAIAWRYNISDVSWKNVDIADATYAITYRESDGLLISCHEFKSLNIKNGNFNITWISSPAITIASDTPKGSITVDSNFDLSSNNPLENKSITDMFKNLGVVFTNSEGEPEDVPIVYPEDSGWFEDIDQMTSLKGQTLTDLFNNVFPGGENSENEGN